MGKNRILRSWKLLGFTGTVLVLTVLYCRRVETSATAGNRFFNSGEAPILLCFGWVVSLGYLVRLQQRKRTTVGSPQNRDVLLNAIMDGGRHAIVVAGPNQIIKSFNRASERLYGYDAAHFVGKKLADLGRETLSYSEFEKEAQRLSAEFGRPITPGEVFDAPLNERGYCENEWTLNRRDGTRIFIRLTVSIIRGDDGELHGYLGLAQDITERRMLEDEVRRHAMLLNAVMDGGRHGIIMTDRKRDVTIFNRAGERLYGYDAADFLGGNVSRLVDAIYDRSELEAEAERLGRESGCRVGVDELFLFAIRKYGTYEHEWTAKRSDGTRFPILVTATAIRDQKGEVYGSLGIHQDISERKELENVRNDFISTASHELRTPLTSIRGALGLVSSGALGELPGKIMEVLHIAQKNCERLVRIINDILDVEKIEAGRLEMNAVAVGVSDILEQALEANRDYVGRYGVQLVVKDVPSEARVWADADRLMQIMANLISNAAKFSLPGSEVWLGAECSGNRVCFSVRDFGEGIPGAFRASIFEKFAQADHSNTRHNEGTGLGLSIARRLVEMMHGSIRFETEIGEGTTFFFDLPLVENGSPASPGSRGS